VKVFDKGRLVYDLPGIDLIQSRTEREMATLPAGYKTLTATERAPVKLSSRLDELANSLWNRREKVHG
jgi:hypothetical protein